MTDLDLFSMEEVTKILINLGVPANLQGFKFLQECITMVVREPEYIKQVTKRLYPEVGKAYSVNGGVVERSMRSATDAGFDKTGFKVLNQMFGLPNSQYVYKPTSSELIAMISEMLRFKAIRSGLTV